MILNKNEIMIGTKVAKNFKWLQTLLGIIKLVFKSQVIVVKWMLIEWDRINCNLPFLNKLTTCNMLHLQKKQLTSIIMEDQQPQNKEIVWNEVLTMEMVK